MYWILFLVLLGKPDEFLSLENSMDKAMKGSEEKIQSVYLFSMIKKSYEIAKKEDDDLKCHFNFGGNRNDIAHPRNYKQKEDQSLCWMWRSEQLKNQHTLYLLTDKTRKHIKTFHHHLTRSFHARDRWDFFISKILSKFINMKTILAFTANYYCDCHVSEKDVSTLRSDRFQVTKYFYTMQNGYWMEHRFKMHFLPSGIKGNMEWTTYGEDFYFKSYGLFKRLQYYVERLHHEGVLKSIKQNNFIFFKFLMTLNPQLIDEYWDLLFAHESFAFFTFLKDEKINFPDKYEQKYLIFLYQNGKLNEQEVIKRMNKRIFYNQDNPLKQHALMVTLHLGLYKLSKELMKAFGKDLSRKKRFNQVDAKGRTMLTLAVDSSMIHWFVKRKLGFQEENKEQDKKKNKKQSKKKINSMNDLNLKERYHFVKELLKYPVKVNHVADDGKTPEDHLNHMLEWADFLGESKEDIWKLYIAMQK